MRIYKFKYKKEQKVKVKENVKDYKRCLLSYGVFGLKALETTRLTVTHIEAVKKTIKKIIKKSGSVWVALAANRGVTAKPMEVRMGKGKGAYSYSVAIVQKGTILFELRGNKLIKKIALLALKMAAIKIPIKTEICMYKS